MFRPDVAIWYLGYLYVKYMNWRIVFIVIILIIIVSAISVYFKNSFLSIFREKSTASGIEKSGEEPQKVASIVVEPGKTSTIKH